MTNHIRLLVTPMAEFGIPQMMQALGRRYVYYVNKTYKRTGTLWEGAINQVSSTVIGIC